MSAVVNHTTSLTIVYSTAYSGADQTKLQSSVSPVNRPVTREMFPFDDVIMWRGHIFRIPEPLCTAIPSLKGQLCIALGISLMFDLTNCW